MPAPETYPPNRHFLRDLGFKLMIREGHELGTLPFQPVMARKDGGLPAGAIVTLVDMVTGREAQRGGDSLYPITSDIDLRGLTSGRFDEFLVTASLLHRGRRSAVLDAEIFGRVGADKHRVGTAQANFALFPPDQDFTLGRIVGSERDIDFQLSNCELTTTLPTQLGFRFLSTEHGRVEVDVDDYVKNPLGVLQGGVHAILAEESAELHASHLRGAPFRVSDLSIRYLAAARFGPIQTTSRVVRESANGQLQRVDISDAGADSRLVSTALVHVVREAMPAELR